MFRTLRRLPPVLKVAKVARMLLAFIVILIALSRYAQIFSIVGLAPVDQFIHTANWEVMIALPPLFFALIGPPDWYAQRFLSSDYVARPGLDTWRGQSLVLLALALFPLSSAFFGAFLTGLLPPFGWLACFAVWSLVYMSCQFYFDPKRGRVRFPDQNTEAEPT